MGNTQIKTDEQISDEQETIRKEFIFDKLKLPKFNKHKYNFDKAIVLGQGSYGQALKVPISGKPNEFVIVKIIDISKDLPSKIKKIFVDKIVNEIDIQKYLQKTKCPISYWSCIIDYGKADNNIFIVLDYLADYVTLSELLYGNKKVKPKLTDINDKALVAIELIKGLDELHKNNVIHKDIKPDNILVKLQPINIRYIDFGLSCIVKRINDDFCNDEGGTPLYMPPELQIGKLPIYDNIKDEKNKLRAVDIWSIGAILYEMFLGYSRFDYEKDNDIYEVSLDKVFNILGLQNINDTYKKYMEKDNDLNSFFNLDLDTKEGQFEKLILDFTHSNPNVRIKAFDDVINGLIQKGGKNKKKLLIHSLTVKQLKQQLRKFKSKGHKISLTGNKPQLQKQLTILWSQ